MPPVSRLTAAQRARLLREGRIGVSRRGGRPQFRYRKKPFRWRKGNNRFPQNRGVRSAGNTIALSTLSKKQENLSISYRELIEFDDMGGDNGSTPALLRINLNNPVTGGDTPAANQRIVTLLANTKPGATDPTAYHHAYDNNYNLAPRLAEYFTIYRTCIVTSSEVTVSVTPKLGQSNGMTDTYRSVVPYTTNRAVTNPVAGMPDHYLFQQQLNACPQVEVWGVRQQSQAQLTDAVNGTPSLETLKQGIPGMRMTRINVTPSSSKGVVYKMRYTPKSAFQIKDIMDNKKILQVFKNAVGNPDQKENYFYVGIAGRWKGQDPKASGSEVGLPHFNVEVKIKYNLNFSERFNVDGNNEPTPHSEEL